MRLRPHIYVQETTIAFPDGEAEGWLIGSEWFGLVVEISVARRSRTVEGD